MRREIGREIGEGEREGGSGKIGEGEREDRGVAVSGQRRARGWIGEGERMDSIGGKGG